MPSSFHQTTLFNYFHFVNLISWNSYQTLKNTHHPVINSCNPFYFLDKTIILTDFYVVKKKSQASAKDSTKKKDHKAIQHALTTTQRKEIEISKKKLKIKDENLENNIQIIFFLWKFHTKMASLLKHNISYSLFIHFVVSLDYNLKIVKKKKK